MSDLQKLYHWTNVILIPLLLILLFIAQGYTDQIMPIAVGWALISAVLNERLRTWVIGFFSSITISAALVGCAGSLIGVFLLILIAAIVGMIGFFFILVFLWATSLKAITDEQKGLI